jgi:hypothetical protein
MTSNEFGVGVFWNVDYDGLWKNNVNLSSRFIIVRGLCCIILADVYNNEYMLSCF